MSTIGNYFNISYNEAVKFINNLSSEKQNKLYSKYNISESISYGNKTYSCSEQVAELVSDDELYTLGYTNNNNIDNINKEYIGVDDVINFLTELDTDILEQLMQKYDTYSIDDLAIVLTDDEIIALGYNNKSSYNDDYNMYDNTKYYKNTDYDENLDFLEDIEDIPYYIIDKDNYIFAVDNSEVDFEKFKESLDYNLVQTCDKIDDLDIGDNLILFKVTPIIYDEKEEISEEVVINDTLNPVLFNEDHTLKEDIRQQLIDYASAFAESMSNEDIDITYSDICLVGSNAGYLYKPTSDIDIHFISAEPLNEDIFDELKVKFDLFEEENPLIIDNHNVELGIEDGYNIVMDNKDPRRYSILDSIWVNDSDKNEVYTSNDINLVDGYEEVVQQYADEIDDIIAADEYADAVKLKHELRQNRSTDLANIGALSMGNVVFKELRDNGAYGKLRNYIKEKEMIID